TGTNPEDGPCLASTLARSDSPTTRTVSTAAIAHNRLETTVPRDKLSVGAAMAATRAVTPNAPAARAGPTTNRSVKAITAASAPAAAPAARPRQYPKKLHGTVARAKTTATCSRPRAESTGRQSPVGR